MLRSILCAAFLFCAAPVFAAPPYIAGDAFVRETPMKISAGYVVLKNTTDTADTLTGATADWAGRIELHEIKTDAKGVMAMNHVDSMQLPANGELALRPGGFHLMIFDLTQPLNAGATKSITLHFKNAGDMIVDFAVTPITYTGAKNP